MDLRSLRYAITLAEELHFGRAAQRHYISAQPFGRHIRNLERELGVRLFERTSRRVTVTPAGARFLAQARAIVNAVDALTDPRRWAEPDEEDPAIRDAIDRPSLFAAATSRRVPRFVPLDRACGGRRTSRAGRPFVMPFVMSPDHHRWRLS
ncbi:LysR family transcriptional regulator [Actinoallomurus oryzae]